MKVAPLFLTRKAHKTADPILGFDESRSVQYKFLNAKMFYELYFIFIYFDKKACKLSFEVLIGSFYLFLFFRRFNLFFFFRKRKGGRKRERNIDVQRIHWSVASHSPPTGELAGNPSMRPDWESNQRPFGSQAGTLSTEPHSQGKKIIVEF